MTQTAPEKTTPFAAIEDAIEDIRQGRFVAARVAERRRLEEVLRHGVAGASQSGRIVDRLGESVLQVRRDISPEAAVQPHL